MSETAEHPESRPVAGRLADPFRQMAEAAPAGLVHAAPDGEVMFVNGYWRALTGVTTPTPIPFAVLDALMHPHDRERVLALYVEAGPTPLPLRAPKRPVRAPA